MSASSPPTDFRSVLVATIPRVTSVISILGSSWIILDVVRDRKKQASTYHRLLIGLSVSDILASLAMAFSTTPIPEDSDLTEVYGASGTTATCDAQGFFIQMGLVTPLYSAFLAIYFWMQVAYPRFKEGRRDLQQVEVFFHAFSWAIPLITAFASLGLKLFNNGRLWCWISSEPMECVGSMEAEDGVGTCERGDNAKFYRMIFYFLWLWLAGFVVMVCMGAIFKAVYTQGQKMKKYLVEGQRRSHVQGEICRDVGVQGVLYISAFLITALPITLQRLLGAKENCTDPHYWLTILTTILFPLQGFWNFLIYMRPKYVAHRKCTHASSSSLDPSSSSRWSSLRKQISLTFGKGSTMTSFSDRKHTHGPKEGSMDETTEKMDRVRTDGQQATGKEEATGGNVGQPFPIEVEPNGVYEEERGPIDVETAEGYVKEADLIKEEAAEEHRKESVPFKAEADEVNAENPVDITGDTGEGLGKESIPSAVDAGGEPHQGFVPFNVESGKGFEDEIIC